VGCGTTSTAGTPPCAVCNRRFETAEAAYQWLTRPLFIASGARYPDRVFLSVFEVG